MSDESSLNGPYVLDLARKGMTLLPGEARKLALWIDAQRAAWAFHRETVLGLHAQAKTIDEALWTSEDGTPLLDVCNTCGQELPCDTYRAIFSTPEDVAV